MTARTAAGEDGFALVAALTAAMLFAFFAYAVLAADRGAISGFDAQLQRAKLEAAADAGLAMAVEGLGAPPSRRWPIDGRSRTFAVDDAEITATLEDERGKVALDRLQPDQVRRLFQAAGVSGARLDQLTDNLLDWEDGGERLNGARTIDYAADDVRPRRGPVRTLGELMAIKGMDSTVFNRITPALTLFFGVQGDFDRSTASPLAVKVMRSDGESGPDAIVRAREQAGQRTALAADPVGDYAGRPVTVRITARNALGGAFRRSTIVELTGQPGHPFWVRAID